MLIISYSNIYKKTQDNSCALLRYVEIP